VRALLISTYDLGRQPFGLASAAAVLRAAGAEVSCADLTRDRLNEAAVVASDAVAFFLPMHTATRLALPVIDRVRELNPAARLIAYGLYAPLNESLLRERGVHEIVGGEFEDELARLVSSAAGEERAPRTAPGTIPRVSFQIPDRSGLPPLSRYATLQVGGQRRLAGYTEASRGCKHRCRHCPIVPVYDGRFRIVPPAIVLEDVRRQVAAGAQHITFGDPDFLNGPKHAREVLTAFGTEFPGVTYDVTIKVEHLLAHADVLPLLRETGCLFVTSAVESIDDGILGYLEKGHTRSGFEQVVRLCAAAGVTLVPTFVAFTPWTTLRGYCELLAAIDACGLIEHVSPVQLVIRLLIPQGSRLLELADVRSLAGAYSPASLTYPWRHPDARVDALQRRLEAMVGTRLVADRRVTFDRVWEIAFAAAQIEPPPRREAPLPSRATIPYLNEPWYC
jgi:radical SAM superfamily enzyme YgiQ (UPF0313 family)